MTWHVGVAFGGIAGTGAALGTTGRLSLVADRPTGEAGGSGLGFNGAELLAMAIGGCFWDDMHRVAAAAGYAVSIDHLEAEVTVAGAPPRVVRGRVAVRLSGASEDALATIFEQTCAMTTVATSIAPAVPIAFERR